MNKTLLFAVKKMLEKTIGRWVDELPGVLASYLQIAISHYNRKVRPRAFRIGTLVLRKFFENTVEKRVVKL